MDKVTAPIGATGSVETPEKTTPPATPGQADRQASAEQLSTSEGREAMILRMLQEGRPGEAQPDPQAEAKPEAGKESPPAEGGETASDLSQSNPESAKAELADREAGAADADAPKADRAEEDKADEPGIINRLRRLKDQKRELKCKLTESQAEIESLRGEIDKLKAQVQQPQGLPGPGTRTTAEKLLAGVSGPEDLVKYRDSAQATAERAADLLLEVNEDPEGVAKILEAAGSKPPEDGWSPKALREELRALRDAAQDVLREVPKRHQWITTETAALQTVAKLAPEMADDASAFHGDVQDILEARPWLRDHADWPLMAVAGAIGLAELRRRATSAGAPAKPKAAVPAKPLPKPPRVPGAPRATVQESDGDEQFRQLKANALARGSTAEDREAWIAAQLRATKR